MEKKNVVKRIAFVLCLVISPIAALHAQMLIGTQGMVNAPTADMNKAGTFVGGVSYIPNEMGFNDGDYNTGAYYVNFTPFSWMELTLRETLSKSTIVKNGKEEYGFHEQDRSTTLRLRPLAEKDSTWLPSVVAGINDIYSDHGMSYYTCMYGVVTKHFQLGRAGRVGVSVGYAHKFEGGRLYDGAFGGVDFRPSCVGNLRLMADWDTSGLNVGAQFVAFKHLNLMVYTREFKCCGAGISYQYTIRY